MKNSAFYITFKKEVIVLSVFFAALISYLFFGKYNDHLTAISTIQMSRATIDGIDVAERISHFYQLIAAFTFLILLIYPAIFFAQKKWNLYADQERIIVPLAVTGILLILSSVYGINCDSIITIISGMLILTPILTRNKKGVLSRLYSIPTFLSGVCMLSFLCLGIILFLLNTNELIQGNSSLLFFLLLLIFSGLIAFFKSKTTIALRSLFLYLSPIAFAPLLIFIAAESVFYFKLNQGTTVPFKWFFLGILVVITALQLLIVRFKKINFSTTRLITLFYAPSALLFLLLFAQYQPIITQPQELFELANPAVTQMRVFAFSEIPFVDFMSSHMFSEQIFEGLYHLVFGYNGSLDFLTYQFLYSAIFYFIAYLFLRKTIRSASLAMLFLMCFPLLPYLFYNHLFYGILAFFAVQKATNNQSVWNYLSLGLILTALCFWRLDLGYASVMATAFFFPINLFTNRTPINIQSLLKAFGIFFVICLSFFTLLMALRDIDHVASNVNNFLHYISANQAHGLSVVTTTYGHQFFIHHLILPISSVLIILYSICLLRMNKNVTSSLNQYTLSASIFLFLIYLANFQRGIVRHSFAENTDSFLGSTFYLALALFLISVIGNNKSAWKRYTYFLGISFGCILFLKYFPIDKEASMLHTFFQNNTLKNFDTFLNSTSSARVLGKDEFAQTNHADFKLFLDQNLSKKQTFLDFSNTPMLYYYCQRRVPSYFCQNLQNTIDDHLQFDQLKRINTNEVPVVVYSNYPQNWWDNTDGVSNIMRQYLIAEYIHTCYKPFAIINNRSIWIAKSLQLNNPKFELDTTLSTPKVYHYENAAWLINDYINENCKSSFLKMNWTDSNLYTDNNKISVPINPQEKANLFIQIVLKTCLKDETVQVEFFSKNGLVGTNTFQTKKGKLAYMMPISNHYLWTKETVTSFSISKHDGYKIDSVQLFKDARNEN